EDGIRDFHVTGVQTCALPIYKLTALHAALMNGGVFVYVPKNVQVEEPIQAIFWQEDPEVALVNHVLVVAEENSSLTYVENYISRSEERRVGKECGSLR